MELSAIPGVGEKTAAALSELDDPEAALTAGDVATLARAPGVTEGRAARIARAAIRAEHDDPGGFLATDRAREVYREMLALLKARTVTDYAAKRVETFYPSTAESRIEEVQTFAERAMGRSVDDSVLDALAGVAPLDDPRDVSVRDRCLATTDAETYSAAREAVPELPVEIVEDARGLAELARGYATVIALDERFSGIEVEGDVRVEPRALEDPESVVPERVLAFFAANRDRLRAAVTVHEAADLGTDADLAGLSAALSRLDDDGGIAGDDEVDRLETAISDLDAAVGMAENIADDHLRQAIQEKDVTIEGGDLLSLVERGAGVDSLLSRELADEYAAAVAAARDDFVDSLHLDAGEAEVARRVFGDEPTYPVERDEQVVSRLREDLTAAKSQREARLKREVASDLADQRPAAEALVRDALELDVELALARFASDLDCVMPTFEGDGFAIEGGRSPLLDVSIDEVDPVDYDVSGVALLSGVNSGGKTSTLDLVAAVVVLAHMGLPVPAKSVRLQRFADLHYHAKTQGTLDAGAFESTVREFAGLADGGQDSLVLVDELESITEPGASAKIIAGILEALDENGASAVFVSHLADEIREMAEFDVTVDGIEAKGLEDGELVVDRSPVKDHLARSTPELIVEKLAGEGETDFYDRLLQKF
ncbi:MutS-related protein [Haloarchaeobius sp. DFWS5]|uniref:MutS-related protein n=1 Tax=Haloarchaeobius sp. DFWS5 TaxID=3446114 RepID=UPI003EC12474